MFESREHVDTEPRFGPVTHKCNVCGEAHMLRHLSDEMTIAPELQREPSLCLTMRAAIGLLHTDQYIELTALRDAISGC